MPNLCGNDIKLFFSLRTIIKANTNKVGGQMGNYLYQIKTVDTHTMGEATRVVIDGFPEIVGSTMSEKKQYVSEHYDHLRQLLMNEPRGHNDMFGAVITKPAHPQCDIGLLFMDSKSYLNMCGHGTIGSVTMCIMKGYIEKKPKVLVDTPSGIITCHISYFENGDIEGVTFTNVPSFVLYDRVPLELAGYGIVYAKIAFGGSFFGILNAEDLQLDISLSEKEKLIAIGLEAREKLNAVYRIQHPFIETIQSIDLIEISRPIDERHYKNVVIFGDGQIDRSPCGTGTCAKMATLDLTIGEEIIHESIIGSTFTGRVSDIVDFAGYKAIIPSIFGQAWITGEHSFVLQHNDIFPVGFKV